MPSDIIRQPLLLRHCNAQGPHQPSTCAEEGQDTDEQQQGCDGQGVCCVELRAEGALSEPEPRQAARHEPREGVHDTIDVVESAQTGELVAIALPLRDSGCRVDGLVVAFLQGLNVLGMVHVGVDSATLVVHVLRLVVLHAHEPPKLVHRDLGARLQGLFCVVVVHVRAFRDAISHLHHDQGEEARIVPLGHNEVDHAEEDERQEEGQTGRPPQGHTASDARFHHAKDDGVVVEVVRPREGKGAHP
mmetsp:Transcript_79598/g.170684  ORF Transcript_79598/g.170684 Transcript_79598/m.170684 type:complete len:246 (+) Transcript_79598:806-1543(+)